MLIPNKETPCALKPCKNGGTCMAMDADFTCKCPENCNGVDCSVCTSKKATTFITTTKTTTEKLTSSSSTSTFDTTTKIFKLNLIETNQPEQRSNFSSSTMTASVSIATTPIPTAECMDLSLQLCKIYATESNCKRNSLIIKGKSLHDFCPKTCQLCDRPLKNVCNDSLANCKIVKDFCEYFDQNRNPCKLTCNSC